MNEPPAFLSRKGRLCVCCCHGDESTASDSFDHHLLWKKIQLFFCGKVSHWRIDAAPCGRFLRNFFPKKFT